MEVRFKLDIKTVRKALAMLDVDIPSDEEIISRMDGKLIDITKFTDEENKQAELGFAIIAISQTFVE